MLLRISHASRYLLISFCLLQYTTFFGSAPEEPPKKKRKISHSVPSLKLLASKEVVKSLQSNYMDAFDKAPQEVIATLDNIKFDFETHGYIAGELLKAYKAQITAKNVTPGIKIKKERLESCILVFSADGNHLAYTDQQYKIHIRNARIGGLRCTIHTLDAEDTFGKITALCFDNNNEALAVGHDRGSVQIYSIQDEPKQLHVFNELSTSKVTCLKYHPDNSKLAFGSYDGVIYLKDTRSGQLLQTFGNDIWRAMPVLDIGFLENGGIYAQIDDSLRRFKSDGTCEWCGPRYDQSPLREVHYGNGYFVWESSDSSPWLYDLHHNKLHKLCSEPEYRALMNPNRSMMACTFDDAIQLYHMPTLQDLGSSLSIVQIVYVANRLQNQSWSAMQTITPRSCSTDSDAEQEKKELLDSMHASLPEEFKRVLI